MKLYMAWPSQYSQKAILAAYEKELDLELEEVSLFDPESNAAYRKIYPLGKIPLLITDGGRKIPESSIIVEYLDDSFDSGTKLIPKDSDLARRARYFDRMLDLYVSSQVTTLFFEPRKPDDQRNDQAITQAKDYLNKMYGYLDQELSDAGGPWLLGETFSLADLSANGGLLYANMLHPIKDCAELTAYLGRLQQRPSVQKLMVNVLPVLQKMQRT